MQTVFFLFFALLSGLAPSVQAAELDRRSSASWYEQASGGFGSRSEVLPFSDDIPGSRFQAASSACERKVLEQLGWSIEPETVSGRVIYVPGNPCDNADLASARAEGELKIRIPATIDERSLQVALSVVLGSRGSICAYQMQLGAAAVRASRALSGNLGFYFYAEKWPFIAIENIQKWWGSCKNEGGKLSCFYPRVSNHEAMDDFARGRIGTDCALGLQAMEYSTLRELYGDAGFDAAFQSQEITFAPWNTIEGTKSVTWGGPSVGAGAIETIFDPYGSQTAKFGAKAYVGFAGYIGNVFGEDSLDHPVDRGENFMTEAVSVAAGAQLQAHGGFSDINQWNKRIYELGRGLPPEIEKMALTDVKPEVLKLGEAERKAFVEMQSILANPIYSGYEVFVHPLGHRSLGEHIVRLLERNPRTPYSFKLYPGRMSRGLYVRYVDHLLATCGK